MNTSATPPEPPIATDTTDNLTARLPLGLRAPVKLLHDSAGIDTTSAVVAAASVLTAWAGDQLCVRMPGGASLPVAGSLLMGLPQNVDPERVDQILFGGLPERDRRVQEVLRERARSQLPFNIRARGTTVVPPHSLLRDPSIGAMQFAEAFNGCDQLLVTLSGSEWYDKANAENHCYDGQNLNMLLNMAWGRRARLVRYRFCRAKNLTPGEIKVCIFGIAPEHLVCASAGAKNERDFLRRSLLRHASRFCAEPRPIGAPLGPVISEESGWWENALDRATNQRTCEKAELVPDAKSMEAFTAWERRMTGELESMETLDAQELWVLRNLPYRLYAGFQLARPHATESTGESADLAIELAETIWQRAIQMFAIAAEENALNELNAHAARLLQHLMDYGPLKPRGLMRKESVQRLDYHAPALQLLRDSGRIEMNKAGRYVAITPGLN